MYKIKRLSAWFDNRSNGIEYGSNWVGSTTTEKKKCPESNDEVN